MLAAGRDGCAEKGLDQASIRFASAQMRCAGADVWIQNCSRKKRKVILRIANLTDCTRLSALGSSHVTRHSSQVTFPSRNLPRINAWSRHSFWAVVESTGEFEAGGDHAGRIAAAAR